MLNLIDLIEMANVDLGNYKIHCAIDNKRGDWRPLDAYFAGNFEWGQARQTKCNFQCDSVVSLINLSNSQRWLFVGAYAVHGFKPGSDFNGFIYDLERILGLEHLDGRAIIDFPKTFRASYLVGESHRQNLLVSAIREERMSIADFPGFNGVRLSFEMLESIFRQDHASWKAGLANVSGVYLVTDMESGLQYVGSAYGGVGLWQRWAVYVKTGHGGNKELRNILKKHGDQHRYNFQFALLEVCDINASAEFVIGRENHWKQVLMTREFGLNSN